MPRTAEDSVPAAKATPCARCGDPAEINSWDNVAQIWGYDMCPRCSGEWRQVAPLPTSFPDVRKGYAEFTAQWVKAGRT